MPDIIAASTPSIQYDRVLNQLHGWMNVHDDLRTPVIPMHLIVHLSGGAFKSKLGSDMLAPQGLSADLGELFDPPHIMRKCASWRGMSDEECYQTWNGGQGALVVIDESYAFEFIRYTGFYGIEARVAGIIKEKQDYNVKITSKFSGSEIRYE